MPRQLLPLPLNVVFYIHHSRSRFLSIVYRASHSCLLFCLFSILPSDAFQSYDMRARELSQLCRPRPNLTIVIVKCQGISCSPPSCSHSPLIPRRCMFCLQKDLSGQTSSPFLSTKTSNPLLQYSTAPNVCNVLTVLPMNTLIDLRYTVLLHHDTDGLENVDKDATDYFRGIVKTGEKSARILELTETIIRLNPAHYSAWYVPLSPCTMFISFTGGKAIPLRNSHRHLGPSRARARAH